MTRTNVRDRARSSLSGVRNRFRPSFIIWITVMWCLLMGELTIANVVAGLMVGTFIVFALPLPAMPVSGMKISWGALIGFMLRWVGQLFVASVKVGWLAVRPQHPPKTAIVQVPMRVDNEFVLAFAVAMYNLQPGGAVTDIDIANRKLTVHLLDATSEGDIDREIRAIVELERSMIDIFERRH